MSKQKANSKKKLKSNPPHRPWAYELIELSTMSPTLADATNNGELEVEDVIDEVQRAEIIALVRIKHFWLMYSRSHV